MAAIEPVIYDFKTDGGHSIFTDRNVLKTFITPTENIRAGVRDLYQPDGSCIKRTIPEKLRAFPNSILYDTVGLKALVDLMHYEEEYYLTACERKILETKAKEIAAHIPDNASIFDLGSGSMEKTKILIDHLRTSGKKGIKVYGVDVDKPYMKTILSGLIKDQKLYKNKKEDDFEFIGLHATFEEAIPFIKKIEGPKVFLLLGSTVGNMTRQEAVAFIHQFQEESMKPGDCFYLGFDKRKDPKIIARAYQDTKNCMKTFCMNGLENVDRMLGGNLQLKEKFKLLRGYNDIEGLNEIYYQSLVKQTITVPPPYSGSDTESVDIHLDKGELVDGVYSFKYSQKEVNDIAADANFFVADQWTDPKDLYWFCLLKIKNEQ